MRAVLLAFVLVLVSPADASQAIVLVCDGADGTFIANTSGSLGGNDARLVPHCPSGGTWQTLNYFDDTEIDYALLGITPESILEAFGWGFGVMTLMWFFGFCIGVARGTVNKA